MELLSALVLCTILLSSNAQSPPSVVSAECNDTEKDAGVALDLINKHRRDGYIFSLLRVADAHVQHVGNASIFYFTLDVLETACPVLSRKHWETCGYGPLFGTSDFGRCNAVLYVNRPLRRERLYGYNCTMSPVPPKIYECKRCPVRITVLENVQQYVPEAERILEQYIQQSNHTNRYKVDQVMKVLLGEADRSVYHIEFTIKETSCPTIKLLTLVSGCQFLPDREAHTGFCTGRILNATKDLEGVEVESCEIYDIQLGRQPIQGRPHNDSEEYHHPCNVSGHGCRHPLHRHHHYGHSRPHQHHHHHHHPHHHHHHPHHHHHHPPPPHHHHHHHHHPPRDDHIHRHWRSRCPCGSAGPINHSNSSKESQDKDYPDFPPPPGPHYPPPPPGGPHHFPPSRFPPPPPGPPPPHGPLLWPPPPHHHPEGPDSRPPPRSPCCFRLRHRYNYQSNSTLHERREDASSKDHDLFHSPHPFLEGQVASVYRIPLASEQDFLQAPGADFFPPSRDGSQKAVAQPFPLTPSESESCPGKPTFDLSFDLLPLYSPPPAH